MVQINPYRRNCEVIKSFFAKPIILCIAIFFCIDAISTVASALFLNNTLTLPIFSVLSAIGFFMLFAKGRKNDSNVSFKAPVNLLIATNIIAIVFYSLWIILLGLFYTLTFINYNFGPLKNYITTYFNMLLESSIPFVLYILTSSCFIALLSSIKKSTTSIYLYKKGSIVYSILNFVIVAFCLTALAISIPQIDINDITHISELILTVAELITAILLAVFAIMYNRYISKLSGTILVPEPAAETVDTTPTVAPATTPAFTPQTAPTPIEQPKQAKKSSHGKKADSSLVNMWTSADNTVQQKAPNTNNHKPHTISFEPQPVFANPTPDYSYPDTPILADEPSPIPVHSTESTISFEPQPVFTKQSSDNLYPPTVNPNNIQAPVQQTEKIVEEKKALFCNFCGKVCPPENLYCGACGNKLTK